MSLPTEDIISRDLIAILRGLTNAQAVEIGECLYEAGFRSLEVPLSSPDPLLTIRTLRRTLPPDCVVGAGTVLTADQVRQCAQAGAQMIVSPNTDIGVIMQTLQLGLQSYPGATTPSEAFAAIGAGASNIKVFPANQVGICGLRAWRAVLPKAIGLIPVGGVVATEMRAWRAAGATGFGIGSSLYKAGLTAEELRPRALAFIDALRSSVTLSKRPA